MIWSGGGRSVCCRTVSQRRRRLGWENPQIQIIAHDRGGAYGLAAVRALPDAVQVADRWHLMENASGAFLDAVRKSMRQSTRRSA
ncbi:transposase [Sinorhizobium psoraleae]|uniref:transposase n=1 Tax=Sinorhizobium psoraleae TaxID=520838 RepID=UPI0035E3CE58